MSTFQRLLKLVYPFSGWVVLAVALSFGTIGSSVGLIAMSAYLISKAAVVSQVADLSLAITAVRLFAVSRAVLRYLERYITHTGTFRILTYLRVWFYQTIEPLAPARLMQYRSGDLLARIMADIETLENFYVRVIVPPLSAALVTALACLILGYFNIWIALALIFFLVLTGMVLPLISRWLSAQPALELTSLRAELNAVLVDEVQGIGDLLAFGQERSYQEKMAAYESKLYQLQGRMAAIRGMGNGLAALFASLAGLTVLGLAIPLVSGAQIDGVYLALLPLTAIASFEAVQPLSISLQYLQTSLASGERLFTLIDAQPEVKDAPQPAPTLEGYGIEIRDLSFRYALDEPLVLDHIDASVPSGGRTAILGSSGSGKTTLVNLLLRFWDYSEGDIYIGGNELHEYRSDEVREMISVVPQHTHLFNTTIRDNLLMANPNASEEELLRVCVLAQVHDFIQGLPEGYGTLVGENGLKLSGGERQRLAIARALLKNAPILILDEATSQLDALTERELFQALVPFMAGRTTLIISHRSSVVEYVDQVIRLEAGRCGSAGNVVQ